MDLINGNSFVRRLTWQIHRPRPGRGFVRGGWCAPACAVIVLLAAGPQAAAQDYPASPPPAGMGDRLVFGGQVSAAVSGADPGYFDYSSYGYNLMRRVQIDLDGAFRLTGWLSFVGDLRVDGSSSGGSWRVRPYAAFLRVRPWSRRPFDVQAGIIPPVFGSFSRLAYSRDNPLIGVPLVYQYLTSLSPDSVPASADELLAMRGRGWRTGYGGTSRGAGLPLVDGLRNQVGVEARVGDEGTRAEASAALTSGSASLPAGGYAQPWRQISGRVAVRPVMGLVLGLSASRGLFLDNAITGAYSSPAGVQSAAGFDAEVSRGHWMVRTEGVFTRWTLPPTSAPAITGPLRAFGITAEARYRVCPGVDLAARIDHIGFSQISGTSESESWDAPVKRIEIGVAYSPLRRLTAKVAWQENWRDSYSNRREGVLAAQVITWFR
jgi:hypothetical protein